MAEAGSVFVHTGAPHDDAHPKLTIEWDDDKKVVGVSFESAHFPNWDFIKCVLALADQQIDRDKKAAEMAELQKQLQQEALRQAQAAREANQVNRRIVER